MLAHRCSGTPDILEFRRGRLTCAPRINDVPIYRTRRRDRQRARERATIVPEIEPRESIPNAIGPREDSTDAQGAGRELEREEAAGMRIDATAFDESEIR